MTPSEKTHPLASASDDRTVRLWDVAAGTVRAVFDGHAGPVNGCGFSPDGTLLATASDDRTVRLWDVAGGTVRVVFDGHTGKVNGCGFSPDGTLLATASDDRTVRIWDLNGVCRAALHVAGSLNDCCWHPYSQILSAVGGGGVYLFDYRP